MSSSEYQEYLKSKHWRAFREYVFTMLGRKCQLCRSTENVSVHHNMYTNLHRETLDDVAVLCDDCHAKHHDIGVYEFWPVIRMPDGHLYRGREMRRVG